jgi:predicted RNA-binding Zn-ribbon protein involved in translation (DUF1610 family)
MRDIQLEFICPSCGLQGLTPEVTSDEAIGLARGELKLRCPVCQAIILMRATEANVRAELSRRQDSKILLEIAMQQAMQEYFIEQVIKARKSELVRQLSETIGTIERGKFSRFAKARLTRRLSKTVETTIREHFKTNKTQLVQQLFETGSSSSVQVLIAIEVEKTELAQPISKTIESVVGEKFSRDEKAKLVQQLCETVKALYKNNMIGLFD